MQLKLNYLLWIFLVIFGIFYLVGTLTEIFYFQNFADLWANLFASLIVLLVIEYIVKQSRMKGIEPSKKYIKKQIIHTLEDLIMNGSPDSDWKILLKSNLDWRTYFNLFLKMRQMALGELIPILGNPDFLLTDKLRNDIIQIIELLHHKTWIEIDNIHRNDIWSLCKNADLSSAVINQSIETIKQNELLENYRLKLVFNEGEAPQIVESENEVDLEHERLGYEIHLNRAIEFRDECHRRKNSESS